jgi:hypothetical protein
MKQFLQRKIIGLAAVVGLALLVIDSASASDRAASLRVKTESVKIGINHWFKQGKDPSQPMKMLMKAKGAFDRNNPDQGESLLNAALKILGDDAKPAPADKPLLPLLSEKVRSSKLFGAPEEVVIQGYHDDCMEPFISRDGKYIFFNNSKAADVKTHIHFAKRIDRTHFKYIGELAGAQSKAKDMAPTMDIANHMYFTSWRSFYTDQNSLYVGSFAREKLQAVTPALPRYVFDELPGSLCIDCDITPDGKSLVVSHAIFGGSLDFPGRSDLRWCDKVSGRWVLDPRSEEVLAHVNSEALEYAPSITNDRLELYFTRAGAVRTGKGFDTHTMIMVATRRNTTETFAEPERLINLTGFIEAPTLSLDGKEMFFHKKKGNRFILCRAVRNPNP